MVKFVFRNDSCFQNYKWTCEKVSVLQRVFILKDLHSLSDDVLVNAAQVVKRLFNRFHDAHCNPKERRKVKSNCVGVFFLLPKNFTGKQMIWQHPQSKSSKTLEVFLQAKNNFEKQCNKQKG